MRQVWKGIFEATKKGTGSFPPLPQIHKAVRDTAGEHRTPEVPNEKHVGWRAGMTDLD
jgi:hypothetical protein